MKVWDFLPEFVDALTEQLKNDDIRWGDTWLKRPREGQEERTIENFRNKFDKYLNGGQPINWLAIAGDALICWIRESHPEFWESKEAAQQSVQSDAKPRTRMDEADLLSEMIYANLEMEKASRR